MAKADNHEGTIIKTTTKSGDVVYRCRIFVGDEKRKYISASASTQREARAKAKAKYKLYSRQKKSNINNPKAKSNQSVKSALDEYLQILSVQNEWKHSSLQARQCEADAISRYIGTKKISELSASVCNQCLTDMLKHYDRYKVKKCRNLLCRFINSLFIDSIIIEDFTPYIIKINIPKVQPTSDDCLVFDGDEIDKIKALAMNETIVLDKSLKVSPVHNLQYKAMICYLLFLTGMRSQEMRALEENDIDFVNHRIAITKAMSRVKGGEKALTPKTEHSQRIIGINQHTEECFSRLIELRPQESAFLCIAESGSQLTGRVLLDWFDAVLQYAGIEKNGRTVHSLRHTFISLSIDNDKHSPLWNKSISRISRYVGHSKISTTLDIYTQVKGAQLQEVDYDSNEIELIEIEYK